MKKFASVLGIAIMLIAALAVPVSANNHTDTYEHVTIPSYAYMWSHAARYKEDMSFSYQRCINAPRTYTSWVFGSSKTNPANLGELESQLTKPGDPSQTTPRYIFQTGTTRYMQNWVRENNTQTNLNVPYAGMMFFGGAGYIYEIYCAWSPDSV